MPSLLRTPAFRSFWIGETVSVIGDQLTLLATPLVAMLVLDADARDMGALTAVIRQRALPEPADETGASGRAGRMIPATRVTDNDQPG